jgi:predicted dehydrogenase
MMTVRVALAGLGTAAKSIHLPALRKIDEVEVVGGFDPAGSADGVRQFATFDDLICEGRPDIIVIATPPAYHLELARNGLAAGCHIFCEKPLANSLEEADEMQRLAKAANRHIVVNSEFPYMPIHLAAKAEIGGDKFGNLRFLDVRQSFFTSAETEAGWRGEDMQRTFKEFGTHVLDLCKFFFGERPIRMQSKMPRPGDASGPDYLCIVELEFSGDRHALIVLDRLTRGQHRYLDIRLVGDHSTVETSIGGRLQATGGLRASTKRPFIDLDFAMGGSARRYRGEDYETIARAPIDLFADATERLFRAFLNALESGETPPNDIDEARHTLAMLYGAYEAAKSGKTHDIA